MILEAADVRQKGYRSWRYGVLNDLYRESCGPGWAIRFAGMTQSIDERGNETARTILRGILAPKMLDEIRERVEAEAARHRHDRLFCRCGDGWAHALAILDEYKEERG
jgi:hypothetical protein